MIAHNKSVKRTGCALARAVVKRAIQDLGSGNDRLFQDAKQSIYTTTFADIVLCAGYPSGLLDTLREVVSISKAERKYLTRETLAILRDEWDNIET